MRPLKTIDLYAGVGGIRMGFEKYGFKTIFANDIDKHCKLTYDLNSPHAKLFLGSIQDIKPANLPDFDFLLAGFPCQPFSVAGYRMGFEDERRGNHFFTIARLIKAKKPVGFLLENVKNLQNHGEGKTFRVIENTLRSLGYHIKTRVLNSMTHGNVPQNRERIYIVGFKSQEMMDRFNFPEAIKLTKSPKDLLTSTVHDKYYYNHKKLFSKLESAIVSKNTVYQWRRRYVRENKKGVCPTLTANMGTGGHNVPLIRDRRGIRKLTPYECFRMQGFPKNFKLPKTVGDSQLYKQAGNSVTVAVIDRIAKNIARAIQGSGAPVKKFIKESQSLSVFNRVPASLA